MLVILRGPGVGLSMADWGDPRHGKFMSDEPKQTEPAKPEKVWEPKTFNYSTTQASGPAWMTAAAIGLLAIAQIWPVFRVDPAPPGPAPAPVVVVPVKVEPTDAIATKDGIRLDAERTKLLCDLVNAGDGQFILRYQPVGKPELTRTIVVSGGIEPKPPIPPFPPEPKPDPPEPAPIPVEGFRVLIVYENNPSEAAAVLTKEQRGAMSSQAVRSYLDSKCAKGKDGKTPEWRMWDQHVDATNETDVWKDAMKMPRNVLPWIVISDGKAGFSGPLPANEAELLALLKKYGGA